MNTLKAFVAEDSPVVTDSLVGALEELAPIEVVGAVADERSAVQWMEKHVEDFDLVITDIFLSDGSGLGVLRPGSLLGGGSMNMVVLSNYSTPDMRRKCIELGATQVFDKSSEIDALIAYCAGLAAALVQPSVIAGIEATGRRTDRYARTPGLTHAATLGRAIANQILTGITAQLIDPSKRRRTAS